MTPEQRSALALDHHVVVHANAGAGKTRVLVERFIAIVLSGKVERIEQIVATTFTIKAAAEMSSRIRARLLELSSDGHDPDTGLPFDKPTATRLLEFANNIGAARITTLHSFCASLLRKYSYASGIDVDAQELSQRRAQQWRSDAMRTTVRAWLQGVDLDKRERLLLMLDELDVYTTEETIRDLMISAERRAHLAAMFERGDDAVVAMWLTHVNIVTKQTALTLLLHAQAELKRLQLKCGANVQAIIDRNDTLLDALKRADSDGVLRVVQRVREQLETLFNLGGGPHKVKSKKLFEECSEMVPLPTNLWTSLATFADDTTDVVFERQLALVRTTLDVATDAAATYATMKSDRNAIDFDDMMNLTRTMLQRPSIAADVQHGIRFLMVDEFQDTSPVQFDIIRALVPSLDPSSSPLSSSVRGPSVSEGNLVNLFIVGDAKQSIYGFRGADVRLFLDATRDIVAANKLNGSPDGYVLLSASYRMSPNLLPVVNGICEPVFAQVSSGFAQVSSGFAYSRLTGGREGAGALRTGTCTIVRTDTAALHEHDARMAINDYGADGGDGGAGGAGDAGDAGDGGAGGAGTDTASARALAAEMRHVVQRVIRMLGNADVLVGIAGEPDGTRTAGPGDVAILVRTGQGVMIAGAALREAGVPFQVHSGRSFFSRPEVADIRNLLLWCTDTDDDLAFSALVRSPLLLLWDADIVRIAAVPVKGSLWKRMNAFVADSGLVGSGFVDSGGASSDVLRAHALMQQWTTAVHVLAPTEFVQRVLAESNWYSTLAEDARRNQILLNIEKVIELILAEQNTSNASLRDIILTLTPPASDMEGDRPFAADPDAVQVMTLHAAKGLEFPIVALAGIATRGGGASSTAWSDEIGMTFSPSDMLHLTNRMIGEGARTDEDKRLLYVGLTRAKDHLFISTPYENRKGEDAGEKVTSGLVALMKDILTDVPATVVEFDGVVEQYRSHIAEQELVDFSAPLTSTSWLDVVTATDLLSHSFDDSDDARNAVHDGVRADHGPAYGTLMHDILQQVVQAGDISAEERALIVDNILASRVAVMDAHTLARAEIANVMDSAFVREHAALLADASVETTLLATLDSTILQGMMDVRFERDASMMEVWDWKTNVVLREADIASLALAYQPQAQAYAWLCLQAYPHVQTVRTRLLFTKAARAFPAAWVATDEWTREMSGEIESTIVTAVHALVQRRARRNGRGPSPLEVIAP